jgi:hypothetical protein
VTICSGLRRLLYVDIKVFSAPFVEPLRLLSQLEKKIGSRPRELNATVCIPFRANSKQWLMTNRVKSIALSLRSFSTASIDVRGGHPKRKKPAIWQAFSGLMHFSP